MRRTTKKERKENANRFYNMFMNSNCNQAAIVVERTEITNKIITESVYDNRTETFWDEERIKERGIQYFLNMNDVKETLNWNLNGDDSKYQFKWGQSGKGISEGYAYIFD